MTRRLSRVPGPMTDRTRSSVTYCPPDVVKGAIAESPSSPGDVLAGGLVYLPDDCSQGVAHAPVIHCVQGMVVVGVPIGENGDQISTP